MPRRAVLLFLSLLWMCSSLQAHDLGIAKVSLEFAADNRLIVDALLPPEVAASSPQLPARCQLVDQSRRPDGAGNINWRWNFACAPPALAGEDTVVLDWDREGAFVGVGAPGEIAQGRFFDRDDGLIVIETGAVLRPELGPAEVAWHYFALGVEHILGGWDHLAFVLALCLLASGWQLVRLVTAFTVGHSITLALAVLGFISLPIQPVEACIALSIAFMAREVVRRKHASLGAASIVLAFGLLHGLGFASALRDSGFEQDHLLNALLMFNVGVEIGQLLFVAAVVTFAAVVGRLHTFAGYKPALAMVLGSLGMFWAIQRVAGFWV